MVEAIIKDEKRIFPCCVKLNGEYGLKDVFLGVPVKLGKNGVEEIIELKLDAAEMALLKTSDGHVRQVMDVFDSMNL
jgi:malate dehydrogenase